MKIAFCLITKGDEELENLKGAVESTKGLFDVYITANGEKITKTREWCKENGYHYSYLKWNKSFSEQRNYNFAQAQGYDYILWADSDDVIVGVEHIEEIARIGKQKGFDAIFFDYWYGNQFNGKPSLKTFKEVDITQSRERLIKPETMVWKKRLHESPVPFDGDKYKYSKVPYSQEYPVVWMHLGADKDVSPELMKARMERNRELLELDLKDERVIENVDPRTILYLMKIYAEDEDKDILTECIRLGEEYLEKSGWDEERATCCRLMATCYGKLGEHTKARRLLHNAVEEYPHDPILYLHLSRVYFNLKNYSAMKHWLEVGLSIDKEQVVMANIIERKVLASQLMLQYYWFGNEKNARKAWEAARILNSVDPSNENQQNEDFLFNQKELDIASENVHKLLLYLKDIKRYDLIPGVIETLPYEMQYLPFAQHFYNKYKEPKIWGEKEICYYATFGGPHFEQWSPLSLRGGIGGSETAVIELSRRWVEDGYKVTVYGDPGRFEGNHDGVLYLPWYKFNPKDKFNIFIQWRDNSLAGKISAKKYLVDLHDLFWDGSYNEKKDSIDKLMVKSEYHSSLAPDLTNKEVIGNGI